MGADGAAGCHTGRLEQRSSSHLLEQVIADKEKGENAHAQTEHGEIPTQSGSD